MRAKTTALPKRWTKLRYHAKQAFAYTSRKRFVNLACGRGSGKTEICKRKIVRKLGQKHAQPGLYFFALPTYNQAKRVAWNDFCDLIPESWLVKKGKQIVGKNISDMVFETIFGNKLYVVGMDQPARIEGVQWDGGVIDESCDTKPGVFDRSVRPAMLHKPNAWCYRIGVPKRFGIGAMEFKETYDKGLLPKDHPQYDPDVLSLTWPSWDIIDKDEIEKIRASLSEKDFNEQCGASWEKAGGLVYHAFDDAKNVSMQAEYRCFDRLVVTCDFNVSPMAWALGHIVPGPFGQQIDIFDEIYERDTNTEATLDLLYDRYGDHSGGITFYGDASSNQRKTSASVTDYASILNDNRWTGKEVLIGKKNPSKVDRYASVNRMLCNVLGERRVRIHPRCVNLIRDLNVAAYKEGTRELNDQGGLVGHITDAFGYLVWEEFPIEIVSQGLAGVAVS